MSFPIRVLALVWLAVFCLLTAISIEHLMTPVTPGWDIAADMQLQNRIRDEGFLLTGHYSRWEFNHPGPFWFYYNHVVEGLLSPFELSRVQVWHWGALLLSSVFIAYAATGLSLLLKPANPRVFALATAALLVGFIGPELIGIWMPERLTAPYAAFLVSLALLSRGHIPSLPVAVLLLCILVHGYVTMPVLTLPFLAWGCWMAWRRQGGWPAIARYPAALIGSGLIILLFVSPLVADFILREPSNISRILAAQARFGDFDKPGINEILGFIGDLLGRNRSWQWACVGLLLLLLWRTPLQAWHRPSSRFLLKLLLAVTLFVFLYYSRTPSPLFAFIAKFYLAVPPLALAAALLYNEQKRLLAAVVILLMLAPYFRMASINDGADIRHAAETLEQRSTKTQVRLDYKDHDQWPHVAGILLELDRRGVEACTTWSHMAFLYTQAEICPANTFPTHRLIKPDGCTNDCLFVSRDFGVQPVSLMAVTPGTLIHSNAARIFFKHWQETEAGFRWTRGTRSEILFRVADQPFAGRLNLVVDTLGEQSLTLSLNGEQLYSERLEGSQQVIEIRFDPQLLNQDGVNVLTLQTPDAHAPGGPDTRILAIALRSLTFE